MDAPEDQENAPFLFSSQDAPPSSPLAPSSRSRTKPKGTTSVTPRRWTRFFKPRNATQIASQSGSELRKLTQEARAVSQKSTRAFDDLPDARPTKRQRACQPDEDETRGLPTPPQSSPPVKLEIKERPDFHIHIDVDPPIPKPIRRAKKHYHVYPKAEDYTASLWSSPDETYRTLKPNGSTVLPFCIATCNTNSLAAIGDEYGQIKIVDSDANSREGFNNAYVSIQAHYNAVMDVSFSSDDRLLCSGGGDQTARIIDMRSQKTILLLNEHNYSLRQVRFQPGNDNIIATSSRDGTVLISDLRCETRDPRRVIGNKGEGEWRLAEAKLPQGKSFQSIKTLLTPSSSTRRGSTVPSTPTTRSNASITTMTFLNESQPNLLFTGCDNTSRISLWDLRFRQRSRASAAGASVPVSVSQAIPSHAKHRDWGLTSISLSADSARLYALCRDNSVYVYSTSHLALGAASAAFANSNQSTYHRPRGPLGQGALPLYALTSPSLHVSTFFVRGDIRRPIADKPELFATGTADPAPVVFPTDEKVLRTMPLAHPHVDPADAAPPSAVSTPAALAPPSSPPGSAPSRPASRNVLKRVQALDPFPTYVAGIALTGAHGSDVTAVSWTADGELVSIADDCTVRVWRDTPGVTAGRSGSWFERRPAMALRRAARTEGAAPRWFGRADGPGMDDFDLDDG